MGPVEEDAAIIYLRPETAQGSYVNFKNVQQSVAQEAAVRHRPDRQELPQRDLARQLRVPDARVRADGDAVLRPPGPGRGSSRSGCRAAGLVQALRRDPERGCGSASTHPTSSPTTPRRRSTSSTASRSAGRSSRASTTAATSTCRATSRRRARTSSTSTRRPRSTSSRASSRRPAAPDRAAFTFLIDAYREEEVRGEKRVVLGLHPQLAPYKVAVLPLLKKRPEIVELATLKADLART